MGFMRLKKSGSTSVASKSNASSSRSSSTEEVQSKDSANKTKHNNNKFMKKGQKLLFKVIAPHANTSNKKAAAHPQTPAHEASLATNTQKTPATKTLVEDDYDISHILQQQQQQLELLSSFEYKMRPKSEQEQGTVSASVLEEREMIRQQLFYAEATQGVEVTAQFRSLGRIEEEQQQQQQQQQHQQASIPSIIDTHLYPNTHHENRYNPQSTIHDDVSPIKTTSHNDESDSLPPTPQLDPSEADPVARFPAVKAAMEAHQPLGTTTTTITSSPVVAQRQQQQQQQSKRTTTVSPDNGESEKPFDESPPKVFAQEEGIRQVSPSPDKPFDEAMDELDHDNYDDDDVDVGLNQNTATAVGCSANVTRKLLDVFNCGDNFNDFTEFSGSSAPQIFSGTQCAPIGSNARGCRTVDAFYDNSCWTYQQAAQMKRPYYDERFAQRFTKDMINEGVNVLWHLPPENDEYESPLLADQATANWSGKSAVMNFKPGSCYADNDAQPKLTWTTMRGGVNDNKKAARFSVPLLAVQSISTFQETICEGDELKENEYTETSSGVNLSQLEDNDDICLFAITTHQGDVQVFEAASVQQRDLLVTGLKNVMARLSFHLILGDVGASSELYYEEEKNPPPGELPSFSSPIKNMNRIAHALMD